MLFLSILFYLNFVSGLILMITFVGNNSQILNGVWFTEKDISTMKNEFWFYRTTFGKIVNIIWLASLIPTILFMYIVKVLVNLY